MMQKHLTDQCNVQIQVVALVAARPLLLVTTPPYDILDKVVKSRFKI